MNKYEQRASLLAKMRAFATAHETMTDEQVSEYSAIEMDFDKIDMSIKREEALNTRETNLSQPTAAALIVDGIVDGTDTEAYRNAFDMFVAGGDMREFKNVMSVGTDSEGGYIVPVTYQRTVLEKLNALGRTRGLSNVIATESTLNIPVEGAAPTFAWIAEKGAYGASTSTFGQVQIGAHKLGGIIKVSEELLADNMINFDQYMAVQIASGVDKAESPAFAVGTGSGQPKGYAYLAPVGTSSTVAAVAAVTADEIINIYYDLKEEYRSGATWRMTDKTEKALRKLKNTDGDYIYDAGLAAGERATLLGKPIVIDNSMPELGAGNIFIVLGNFDYYQIADRGNITIQRLNELYAADGYIGFKVTKRVDGKPTLAEAFNAGKNAAA